MGSLFRSLLLVAITTCLAIGLACLIVGAVGDSWWNSNELGNSKEGLWRTTFLNIVYDNKYVLRFGTDNDQKQKDVILILIIIGGGFAFLGMLCIFFLWCFHKSRLGWKCCSAFLIIFTFFAGGSGLAAVIYSEVVFKSKWKIYDHGYAAILAWIGGGICFVGFMLSLTIICFTPSNPYSSHAYTENSGFTYRKEKVLPMENLGYHD